MQNNYLCKAKEYRGVPVLLGHREQDRYIEDLKNTFQNEKQYKYIRLVKDQARWHKSRRDTVSRLGKSCTSRHRFDSFALTRFPSPFPRCPQQPNSQDYLLLTTISAALRSLKNRGLQISSLSVFNINSTFTYFVVCLDCNNYELWPNNFCIPMLMLITEFCSFINMWSAWSGPDHTILTQQQSIS